MSGTSSNPISMSLRCGDSFGRSVELGPKQLVFGCVGQQCHSVCNPTRNANDDKALFHKLVPAKMRHWPRTDKGPSQHRFRWVGVQMMGLP